MQVIPTISLKGGQAVCLKESGLNAAWQVAQDPVAAAQACYDAGVRYLHMVDLDGAREGVRRNGEIVRAVAGAGLKIELGGGIRSMQDLDEVFQLDIWRAVIGSAAVNSPEFVRAAVEKYGPEHIAVSVDAKEGLLRTGGWEREERRNYLFFSKEMAALGVKYIIFTDIAAVGTLSGPSFARLKFLRDGVDCFLIAAGGVSSNADLRALNRMGLPAAIVGKAWYTGTVDLRRAVEEAGPQ